MANRIAFFWHITDCCNLRCKHCYQDTFTSSMELPLEKIKYITENITAGQKEIDLFITGGEPFLRNDFFNLLDYLSTIKEVYQFAIVTNGTLITKDLVDKLTEYNKLNRIYLSIEGSYRELNDNIRGEGTFDKVLAAIYLLKDKIEVTIMFTMLKSNISDVCNMIDMVMQNGISSIIFERFIPMGRGWKIKEQTLSAEELQQVFYRILYYTQTDCPEEELLKYRALKVVNNSGILEVEGAVCAVGTDSACILPNGTLLPCRRLHLPLCNLLTDSFEDLWNNSPLLQDLRNINTIHKICTDCNISGCRGCRALPYALYGNYLAKDPHCWKHFI